MEVVVETLGYRCGVCGRIVSLEVVESGDHYHV